MSRQGWYSDVEEAIKACNEALGKTFWAFRDRVAKNPQAGILREGAYVVPKEEVEKIKEKLKNILRTSCRFKEVIKIKEEVENILTRSHLKKN